MTIEEFTNPDKDDAFIYWLESHLQTLGSIWGGSAFKFGVYCRDNTDVKENRGWPCVGRQVRLVDEVRYHGRGGVRRRQEPANRGGGSGCSWQLCTRGGDRPCASAEVEGRVPLSGPRATLDISDLQGLPQNLWVGIGGIVGPARVRVCSPRSRRFAPLRPRSAGHGLDRSSAHARGRLLSDDA